jgi:folate-binding protein YgfZ
VPDIRDEYRIILEGAGWIDRPGRGRLLLDGPDATTFLQALVSNDVAHVQPNEGRYAAYLTPNGRMLADLELYRMSAGWQIGLTVERAPLIAERLDQSIFSEDVRIVDASSEWAELAVVGGAAVSRLAGALELPGAALEALPELGHVAWSDGFVARVSEATMPMFVVIVPVDRRPDVVDRLGSSGAVEVSGDLLEAMRIDAGRPRFGLDMNEDTIPLEAGLLERAISTTKGCYVGQEIIIRILHRGGGRVAKRLVTLELGEGPGDQPSAGTPLVDGGKVAGHLTSVARSLRSPSLIALGYLHRDSAEVGRHVVVGEGGPIATVTGFGR